MTDILAKYCPYCADPILESSRDHIFPEFLGGRRRIDSCGTGNRCNNLFGHTIEANSAEFLKPIHVFLATCGLQLTSAHPAWKSALVHEGNTFDLSISKQGAVSALSKPVIEKDEEGKICRAIYRSKKEAEQAARGLAAKDKDLKYELREISLSPSEVHNLQISFTLGPDIRRLALKMCIALCTLLPDFDISEVAEARLFLRGDSRLVPVNNTRPAYDDYESIDAMRSALAHTIYVERNESTVYGVVQFFGVFQVHCYLGKPVERSQHAALLATLDPLTGKEQFMKVEPLRLPVPPFAIEQTKLFLAMQHWMSKLDQGVTDRGATHPSDLQTSKITVQTGRVTFVPES